MSENERDTADLRPMAQAKPKSRRALRDRIALLALVLLLVVVVFVVGKRMSNQRRAVTASTKPAAVKTVKPDGKANKPALKKNLKRESGVKACGKRFDDGNRCNSLIYTRYKDCGAH